MEVRTDHVRNVALVGHQGNGKTTLAEALLFRAGTISRMGTVEQGSTVCDTEPEEHHRSQSLSLAVAPFTWDGHHINLIDTPGYADFVGDTMTALRVADLAVFVIDAVNGVQTQDEVLWRAAARLQMPRLIFVNKMDRDRADFDRTLEQIKARFSSSGIEPVELPIGEHSEFHGVADLVSEHAWLYDSGDAVEIDDLPPEIAEREHAEHQHLVEDVVEQDDALLERYLDGDEPSPDELERALHEGVDRAVVFPVLVGSAVGPVAVDRLADFIVHIGPNPSEVAPVVVEAAGDEIEVACDPDGDPLAMVFKTLTDPYVGQLSLFKVLSGTISVDDVMLNSRTGARERLHGLNRVRGSQHTPVDQLVAGDIGAVTKLDDLRTGDTLAPDGMPVKVAAFEHPDPVFGMAIRAANQADEDKLAVALHRVVDEDPALVVERNDATHQTVLHGTGETHILVTIDRIERKYGVDLTVRGRRGRLPRAAGCRGRDRGKAQEADRGRGQFGVATVRFEPLERGAGFEFVDAVVGGAIPRGLIPAVEKGIVESMARGGNHGFPVVDLRATLLDGKHHAVDSDEMSFKIAGSLALREALRSQGTTVLEPISQMVVMVPTANQGDVMGDLSSRRGAVTGTLAGPGAEETTITADVPTAEILRYAIDLTSMTHGRGRFSARFDRYEPMPAHLVAKLDHLTHDDA